MHTKELLVGVLSQVAHLSCASVADSIGEILAKSSKLT